MKMLDLLLKHLPNNGGWPDGADYIADNGHGHVFKYCTKGQISGGSVPCLVRIDSTGLETVTREQYESALSAKNNKPDWDGKGFPPVGYVCEVRVSRTSAYIPWRTIHIEGDCIWGWRGGVPVGIDIQKTPCEFRNVRSPEDVAREKITLNMLQYMYSSDETDHAQVCKIYDAIAAGKIPGIKLDGAA
ncbi:MAG: hypothetical protein ACREXO_00255 [Advenella sp.]